MHSPYFTVCSSIIYQEDGQKLTLRGSLNSQNYLNITKGIHIPKYKFSTGLENQYFKTTMLFVIGHGWRTCDTLPGLASTISSPSREIC